MSMEVIFLSTLISLVVGVFVEMQRDTIHKLKFFIKGKPIECLTFLGVLIMIGLYFME